MNLPNPTEAYISVDIEASGPTPCRYALLAIGACLVADPQKAFYVELQPSTSEIIPEALSVSGLSLDKLARDGIPAAEAMAGFERWLEASIPTGQTPVFVAFNAPFDWAFINEYFHRTIGRNPFGHAALDLKALSMGITGSTWAATGMRSIAARYGLDRPLSHHALRDAQDQAELFRRLTAEAAQRSA